MQRLAIALYPFLTKNFYLLCAFQRGNSIDNAPYANAPFKSSAFLQLIRYFFIS